MKPVNQPRSSVAAKYTMAVTVMMTGVAAFKIRRYEKAGLCKPARTASRQRLYSDHDLKLIGEINKLAESGVNPAGIKIILAMQNRQNPPSNRPK
ncbi:MAG TPA: MerR family transcriptional regulator [Dehalococcoidales bacterium]|nr:MerR family transcriptional regulator [Dehalococcoidales bacterium]